MIEEINMMNP